MNITINRVATPKAKPEWESLSFGTVFTDHMFLMDYTEGEGWHDARIVPYGNIALDPAASVFHYGVEIFEGMKAYHTEDGRDLLFRPDANGRRMNNSAARLCMPSIPVEDFVEAVRKLVEVEKSWIPPRRDMSLYIRPTMIATEAHLGVSKSKSHTFFVILSPVGAYYPEGLNPVRIYVEDEYSGQPRAAPVSANAAGTMLHLWPRNIKQKGWAILRCCGWMARNINTSMKWVL